MAYVPLGDQMARKTTDIGSIFESPIDDLKLQVTTSVDSNLSELAKRISKIERRLDELSPEGESLSQETSSGFKCCSLCEREALARGLCSAHYHQWRYRQRKPRTEAEQTETSTYRAAL